MLLLTLLGLMPLPADPAAERADDPPVAVGPPAPHLILDPSAQMAMSGGPAARAFREKWGAGWAVRRDPRSGSPRFLYAPGVPLSRAADLVRDVAVLAGIDPAALALSSDRTVGTLRVLRWDRTFQGAPVEGDQIAVLSKQGRIGGVRVALTPLPRLPDPLSGEVVFKEPSRGVPLLATPSQEGPFRVYRDRAGRELHRYDTRLFTQLDVAAEARSPGDALLTGPARQISVRQTDGLQQYTSDLGEHTLSGGISALLDGPALQILDNGQPVSATGLDSFTLTSGADIPAAAASVLYHYHVVRDWLARLWPGHALLSQPMIATVNLGPTCNAFYTSGTINFFNEVPGQCYDFGRSADVIYHETGHGIHHYILAAGTFASDVSEGSADYIGATIQDDPVLVPDAFGPGTYIRELDTDRRYPDDILNESHNDGLIWGSFLWNLRTQWRATYGQATGTEMTDLLFLEALAQGPTLTDLAEAVLIADDDDGDLSNSVPHGCELLDLLAQHGLSPGAIGAVVYDHDPLGPQSSYIDGYDVDFSLYVLPAECNALDEDRVEVWYTTGDLPFPADGDPGATGWSTVPAAMSGDRWAARLPRQFPGTRVRYAISAWSDDGTQFSSTWAGRESTVYSFYVGDRREVWCEDFEGGLNGWVHGGGASTAAGSQWRDEWQSGVPAGGGAWDPPAAWSGSGIVSTVLDGDYSPDNAQFLRSPVVNLTGHGPMLLLSYQRFLSVEDATYDRARVLINDQNVWENEATPAGNIAHIDPDWTLHDIPLDGLADAGGNVTFTWELTSDAGLEYGGWQLDRVCVTELDDLPAHWRSHDLQATDDVPAVAVSWSAPYMDPVVAVRLVRRFDAPPASPDDGDILYEAPAAPGQPDAFTDTALLPGESAWYAVFASSVPGEWQPGAVEGQNLDLGGVPPIEDTAPDSPPDSPPDSSPDSDPVADSDPGSPADPDKLEDPACGCATPGPLSLLPLLPLLPLLRRRAKPRP